MKISKNAAKAILKANGAKRVSDEAAMYLAEQLNRFAYSVSKKAVSLAAHAKRETVKKEDVELAR